MSAHLVRNLGWALMLLVIASCSRSHYRVRADKDAYRVLGNKTACRPWEPPPGFTVYPHPRSRFFDPTSPDDPTLPIPTPQLYAYDLPELPEHDPNRFRPGADPGGMESAPESELASQFMNPEMSFVQPASHSAAPGMQFMEPVMQDPAGGYPAVHWASFQPTPLSQEALSTLRESTMDTLPIVSIPKDRWESLPTQCLRRMFEFQSIREEYARSFGHEPDQAARDSSPRLALEDIVQLALINSREYQTEKERLYRAALQVSLARFDYDLKFAGGNFANSTASDYTHRRNGGITQNDLRIPTLLTSDRLMATGGTMLANFANDVLLTFNGPSGFSADIGSEILYDIAQPLIQRDIVLEQLTQVERNLVYAARDYARFRKIFFNDLAVRYYSLLLTYRNIEIESQNYFSNLRTFLQGEAEYRLIGQPRFQVDQFEQSALVNRGALITRCNVLEDSLDRLKFEIGLPPELPINLDLTELYELISRDERVVLAEHVGRARRNLEADRIERPTDRGQLLNSAIEMLRRIFELVKATAGPANESAVAREFRPPQLKLAIEQARMDVEDRQAAFDTAMEVDQPVKHFERAMDVIDAILLEIARELEYAEYLGADPVQLETMLQEGLALRIEHSDLRADYDAIFEREVGQPADQPIEEILKKVGQVAVLKDDAVTLLVEVENLAGSIEALLPPRERDPDRLLQDTQAAVDQLLPQTDAMLAQQDATLVPVEIQMDDALLTAITQRFDLMNQRESLADDWRAIKLTGDDLKSILNLRATQQIRTQANVNRPFAFTFDESTTRVVLRFDAPLNRRSQRNNFRTALIEYNVGLRNLLAAEDGIKLNVRVTLRDLALQRELYDNSVANAALAYERVVSTRIQWFLNLNGIRAQDVLEAQDDYTQSLIAVARNHIDYLTLRIQLFLDLELLQVDQMGFWPQLYDESYQPTPHFEIPCEAQPVYGELPCGTLHSHKIKRMLRVPTGPATIFGAGDEAGSGVGSDSGTGMDSGSGSDRGSADSMGEASGVPGEPQPLSPDQPVPLPPLPGPIPPPPVDSAPPPAIIPLPAPEPPL